MVSDWQSKASTKRQSVLDTIPAKWKLEKAIPSVEQQRDVTGAYIQQFLDAKEVEITETDAVGIAEKVGSGAWKAVDVTQAFCHRAALAHQLVHCLHETFFDAALKDAQALDDYYAKHQKPIGPLHGVPVSLKDQFHVKDVDTHMGYVGWIDTFEGKPDDPRKRVYESEMVRELRNMGAILYCKTSVPASLMSGETVNNIIGYTWNPKNRNVTCGGSSGGEGALIGLKGSPVGFGTDIGGSIRIPAAFNGLFGIRPSSGRLPYEGMANSMDGQNSVLSVVGPIATTARSVKLAVQAILSQSPHLYDPMVIPLPWRTAEYDFIRSLTATRPSTPSGGLCIGILKTDGVVTPQPPILRAISLLESALVKAGHHVVPWTPTPTHPEVNAWTLKTWLYDGGADVYGALALSGEPASAQVAMMYGPQATGKEATASEVSAVNLEQRRDKKRYMDYWNGTTTTTGTGRPVDAVISPLAPYPAARREMYRYYGYSMWVNGLDLTSVVVPVTNVDKGVDRYEEGYTPLGEQDKEAYEAWDAELYDGAHVGVQVVGRRLEEEKMLAVAEFLGGLVGK